MKLKVITLMILLLLTVHAQKPKKKSSNKNGGLIDSIAFTLLGGPYDAPISTRIMNKLGHIGVVLGGALFGYFKLFRKRKDR